MKRILITLTILLSITSMSFANEQKVTARVLESFNGYFKNATEVDWSVGENFYKANFSYNGQYVAAFYDAEGELLAITRNISSTQLPISLQTSLKKNYTDFWISELFEVANEEGTSYYVTVEKGDTKLVLKSTSSDWITFQKHSKS